MRSVVIALIVAATCGCATKSRVSRSGPIVNLAVAQNSGESPAAIEAFKLASKLERSNDPTCVDTYYTSAKLIEESRVTPRH